jgi:hypothetical protein
MTISDVMVKFIEYTYRYCGHSVRIFGDLSGRVIDEIDNDIFDFDTLHQLHDWLIEQTEANE